MSDNPNALATRQPNALDAFKQFIRRDDIITRFEEVLDSRMARPFVNSVILAVQSNDKLLACTKASVVMAAIRAASLRLSVDPATGQAWIIPYGNVAQFQVGYKGLRDMAVRTNKYRTIHAGPVYAGQQVVEDQLTGIIRLEGRKTSDEIIGWQATFVMNNGFAKTLYMSKPEIHDHAAKYSKGYNNPKGVWKQNSADMEKVTVLRLLLRRWAVLDPYDEMIINASESEDFVDVNTIEAEFEPEPIVMQSEEEVLRDLGIEPDPAPVRASTKPADANPYVEQETPAMTLKMAENVVNDKGVRYMDMSDEELVKAVQYLQQSIRTTTDEDRRVEQQFRLSAVNAIQLSRKPTA